MKPKVIEIVPGYGITCTQRQIDEVEASSNNSPMKMVRLLLNVFFTEGELATSSCYSYIYMVVELFPSAWMKMLLLPASVRKDTYAYEQLL